MNHLPWLIAKLVFKFIQPISCTNNVSTVTFTFPVSFLSRFVTSVYLSGHKKTTIMCIFTYPSLLRMTCPQCCCNDSLIKLNDAIQADCILIHIKKERDYSFCTVSTKQLRNPASYAEESQACNFRDEQLASNILSRAVHWKLISFETFSATPFFQGKYTRMSINHYTIPNCIETNVSSADGSLQPVICLIQSYWS